MSSIVLFKGALRLAEPRKISGVCYGTIAGLPYPTFRCGPREATITIKACAGLFEAAQKAKGVDSYRLTPCRSCELGAGHAGVDVPYFGHLYDSMICPRCGNGTTRMIRGRLCVNCYNREREVVVGKNAKGSAPCKLNSLHRVDLRYSVNGTFRWFRSQRAVATWEVCAHVMRVTAGTIVFEFTGEQSGLKQGRLL